MPGTASAAGSSEPAAREYGARHPETERGDAPGGMPAREGRVTEVSASDSTPESRIEGYRRQLRRHSDSLLFAELADLLRRRGDLAAATAVCARGLARHPGYATGRLVMGDILWDQNQTDQAEQEWREALRLDPMHPRAHLRLGRLHLRRGQVDRAIAAFEAALLADPRCIEARELLDAMRQAAQGPFRIGVRPSWQPDALPPWLLPGSFEDLVGAVRRCPSVRDALLVNSQDAVVAGRLDGESGQARAVELLRQARRMIARLGGGGLATASVCASAGAVRAIALESLTLVVGLRAGATLAAADAEIEAAINGFIAASDEGAAHG